MYGTLDAGVTYTTNGVHDKKWAVGNGGIDQNRFGMRGAEDLGDGLKAIFKLESGFNINNGKFANDGMFNGQAFVGLSSDQFGSVTLGHQYDAVHDYLAPLSATGSWGGTYFAHPSNNDNLNTNGGFATNNSVKYSSAYYNGLTFGATYGFSNHVGAFTNNREFSVGAAYQRQGLHLGAAYAEQDNPSTNANGATEGLKSRISGKFRQREFGAGASYAFGPATVGVVWTRSNADKVVAAAPGERAGRSDNYEVNAMYNVRPNLNLGVAYTFTDSRGYNVNKDGHDLKTRYHQIGVHADYALSRSTSIYAQAEYQRAMGDHGVASIYSGDITQASSSKNQMSATVGLRHTF